MSAALRIPTREEHLARQARLNRGMLFRQAEIAKHVANPTPKPVVVDLKPQGFRVIYRWPIGPVADDDEPFMPLPRASGKAIIEQFCAERKVSLLEIKSNRRTESLVHLRHELAFILKEETGKSFPEIGRMLNRDHTSIMNAIRQHVARTNGMIPQWKAKKEKYSQLLKRQILEQREAGWMLIDIAKYHGISRGKLASIIHHAKAAVKS